MAGCGVVCGQESPGVPQRQPACRRGLAGGNQAERDRAVRGTAALGAPRRLRWAVEKGRSEFLHGNWNGKAIHQPHYKPDAILCSLELKDKFVLFRHGLH